VTTVVPLPSFPAPLSVALFAALLLAATGPASTAEASNCGAGTLASSSQTASAAGARAGNFSAEAPHQAKVVAADALAVLRAAVGTRSCDLCLCDVDNSGAISAADALRVLRAAVGQQVALVCPACLPGPDHPAGEIRGFVFTGTPALRRSASTGLLLSFPPFRIGPTADGGPGLSPLAGASVGIEGSKDTVTTGNDGGFVLTSVPAGPRRVRLAMSGNDQRIPVTVVAGATITMGDQQTTRAEVVEIVEDEVVAGLDEPNAAFVVGSQQPLPAGTVLSTEDPVGLGDFRETTLGAPAWLFYVDEYITSAFGHPVRHVLVDDATGAVTVLDRSYWPRLNDVDLWDTVDSRFGDDTVQEPTVDLDPPKGLGAASIAMLPAPWAPAHIIPGCDETNSRTFLLTVIGHEDSMFEVAATKLNGGVAATRTENIVPTPGEDFRDLLGLFFRRLNADMTVCDTLVVYVTSHGGWDDDTGAASGNFQYKRTSASLGKQQSQWLSGSDLLLGLARLKACHLLTIFDTCYAGSFLDPSNTSGVRSASRLLPKAVHAAFVTASDATRTAKYRPISVGNEIFGLETGSLFTNQLIASGLLGAAPLDLDAFAAAFPASVANVAGSPANKQGAQLFVREAEEGAVCGQPACTEEVEPNDDDECADATPVQLEPTPDGGMFGCAVGTAGGAGDKDSFVVDTAEGVDVQAILEVLRYSASLEAEAKTGDEAPLPLENGRQTVNVRAGKICIQYFGDGAGEYVFTIEFPPSDPDGTCTEEVEPNDTCESATPMSVGDAGGCGSAVLDGPADLDHFRAPLPWGVYTATPSCPDAGIFVDPGDGQPPYIAEDSQAFVAGPDAPSACVGLFSLAPGTDPFECAVDIAAAVTGLAKQFVGVSNPEAAYRIVGNFGGNVQVDQAPNLQTAHGDAPAGALSVSTSFGDNRLYTVGGSNGFLVHSTAGSGSTVLNETGPFPIALPSFGVAPLVDPDGVRDHLLSVGSFGFKLISCPRNGPCDGLATSGGSHTTDVSLFGDDPTAGKAVTTEFGSNRIHDWFYEEGMLRSRLRISTTRLNEVGSKAVSAVTSGDGTTIFGVTVGDPAMSVPGKVFLHSGGSSETAIVVGDAGLDPRRIRCAFGMPTVCAVTNFGAGSVSVFTGSPSSLTPAGTIAVADGPVGVDVEPSPLDDGNFVIVTGGASVDLDVLSLVVVSGSGQHLRTVEMPVPDCDGPAHPLLDTVVDGGGEAALEVVTTCNGGNALFRVVLPGTLFRP
jgi:hypothetical protein